MDQDPATPPPDGSGKPGIFQNVNTVIAGLTALVIALGGLAAAWDKLPFNKAEPEAAAAAAPDEAAPPAQPAAAAASEPEQGDPTTYEGGGVKIEWTGEEWLLTGRDGEFHYEDMYSPDETKYLGYDKANKLYLRWPIKGGMAEEGSEDKQTWTTYVELNPVEDSSQ